MTVASKKTPVYRSWRFQRWCSCWQCGLSSIQRTPWTTQLTCCAAKQQLTRMVD